MQLNAHRAGALALAFLLWGCGDDDDDDDGAGTTTAGTMGTTDGTGAMTTATTMTTTAGTTMMDGTTDGMMTTTDGMETTAGTTEAPADTTAADGTAGTTTTGGMAMLCEAPEGDCETCSCDNCLPELQACAEDEGCTAIRECAQENMCTGAECLEVCGDVIDMAGGLGGASAGLALTLSGCVEAECADVC